MNTSSHTAKSAARAGIALRVRRCPRQAAASVTNATASNAAVRGTRSWVSMMSASAVITEDRVATHGSSCRSLRHARAIESTVNVTVTAAANAGERTWKRTVDSHSIGERISADVTPYVILAKRLVERIRTAHTIQKQAYAMATKSTGNFGTELDSAIARNRYAPAIPRTALPSIGTAPDGVSRGGNPRHVAGGRGRCSGISDARISVAGGLTTGQGSFDSASASLREALAPLRMTNCVSRAA